MDTVFYKAFKMNYRKKKAVEDEDDLTYEFSNQDDEEDDESSSSYPFFNEDILEDKGNVNKKTSIKRQKDRHVRVKCPDLHKESSKKRKGESSSSFKENVKKRRVIKTRNTFLEDLM